MEMELLFLFVFVFWVASNIQSRLEIASYMLQLSFSFVFYPLLMMSDFMLNQKLVERLTMISVKSDNKLAIVIIKYVRMLCGEGILEDILCGHR